MQLLAAVTIEHADGADAASLARQTGWHRSAAPWLIRSALPSMQHGAGCH